MRKYLRVSFKKKTNNCEAIYVTVIYLKSLRVTSVYSESPVVNRIAQYTPQI